VREINLLRESNIQLREENKHNFEECQVIYGQIINNVPLMVNILDELQSFFVAVEIP
jgi:hypothetical protein